MSYMLKALWTEEREEYFDSLDDAVATARELEVAYGSVSAYIEGHGIQVTISPLPKEAKV